jgi:hypothetical protein
LSIFVWGIWQKALTEYTKNYLFDLRDDLRVWFLERGHGLDHPSYLATREMLNASLWHVSRASYLQYLIFRLTVKKYPIRIKEQPQILKERFFSPDPEINKYIESVRRRAAFAFGSYISLKSFTVLLLSAFFGFTTMIFGAMADAWKSLKPEINEFMSPAPKRLRLALFALMLFAFPVKSSTTLSRLTITDWSMNTKMVAEQIFSAKDGGFRRSQTISY